MADRYHEVVIKGEKGRVCGFVEGFLSARGLRGRLFNLDAEGFDCTPLRERIRAWVHPSEESYHLLVPQADVAIVNEAITAAQARGLHARLHDDRPVNGARFSFSFKIYSRKHAAAIRAWFEPPPRGAALTPDSTFEEIVHPDSTGVESYAPAHDYELHARGAVEGDVEGVITLLRRCRGEELVDTDAATLLLPP